MPPPFPPPPPHTHKILGTQAVFRGVKKKRSPEVENRQTNCLAKTCQQQTDKRHKQHTENTDRHTFDVLSLIRGVPAIVLS